MKKCKKCNSNFTPVKGLASYCSYACKNSWKIGTKVSEDAKQRISQGVKNNGYLQSEEWLNNVKSANQSEDRIKRVRQTWVEKRDYESAHIGSLKRWYLEDKSGCEECGISEWRGNPIVLEVHHKDSDTNNNTFDNFQALCPNCHSLTEGWRGRK